MTDELKAKIDALVKYAKENKMVFVFGYEVYTPDEALDAIFENADKEMDAKEQTEEDFFASMSECLANASASTEEE